MNTKFLLSSLVFSIILIIFINGCSPSVNKNENSDRKNFDELINLLSQKQTINDKAIYSTYFIKIASGPSGGSKYGEEGGEGKPADDLKKDLLTMVNSGNNFNVKRFYLNNEEKCFQKSSIYICFDKKNNLLYYVNYDYKEIYGFNSWKIASLFPYSDDEVQSAVNKNS